MLCKGIKSTDRTHVCFACPRFLAFTVGHHVHTDRTEVCMHGQEILVTVNENASHSMPQVATCHDQTLGSAYKCPDVLHDTLQQPMRLLQGFPSAVLLPIT